MEFVLTENNLPHRAREISRHASFEEAEAAAKKFPLVMFEEDADNPGCADAFTTSGLLLAINKIGG